MCGNSSEFVRIVREIDIEKNPTNLFIQYLNARGCSGLDVYSTKRHITHNGVNETMKHVCIKLIITSSSNPTFAARRLVDLSIYLYKRVHVAFATQRSHQTHSNTNRIFNWS